MATAPERLAVFTVPSDWTKPGRPRTHVPYARVVGLELASGPTVWVPQQSLLDSKGDFSVADAERELIPSKPIFRNRLESFFNWYLAENSGREALGPEGFDDIFDCHRFGWWMSGGTDSIGEVALQSTLEMVRDNDPEEFRYLALGQRGVLVYKRHGHSSVQHTMVGLGGRVPMSIQVVAKEGNLALRSYEDTLEHYDLVRNGLPPEVKLEFYL